MNRYIYEATGEYPLFDRDVRDRNKSVSFPAVISEAIAAQFGFARVMDTIKPSGDVVTEAAPEKVDGVWKQTWSVRAYNNAELSAQYNNAREAALAAGIEYTFPNGVVDRVQVFDRDMTILNTIRGEAQMNLGDPNFIQPFRSMANNNYFLSAQEVLDMTSYVFGKCQAIYQKAWQEKDSLPT